MNRLTEKSYWNGFWAHSASTRPQGAPTFWKKCKLSLRKAVGSRAIDYWARTYSDYVLWEDIYARYLPVGEGVKALEIGSAPGHYLVRLHKIFGFTPYGVEYAEAGAEQNREVFRRNGIDPANLVFADAFSPEFVEPHRKQFDVVFSRGVIEHFADPGPIIQAHIDVLKPGGLLLVSVPNYRGFNWLLKRILDGDSLPGHNLETMKREVFRQAFEGRGVRQMFCNYYGAIDVSMACPRGAVRWKRTLYLVLEKLQLAFNGLLRIFFGKRAPNHRYTSPFLLYIGQAE